MKRDIKKVMALVMAGSMIIMPASASAEKGGNSGKTTDTAVSADDAAEIEEVSGVIQSVDGDIITVNTAELKLGRFFAGKDVAIKDESGKTITVSDLKAGMTVNIEGDFSKVGMSYPAYYGGTTEIRVTAEKENIVQAVTDNEYLYFEGKVTDTDDNRITVKNGDVYRIFHLSAPIISTEDGNSASSNEISEGDTVTALYTSNTPMALSDPPQINPMMIILHDSDNNVKIDHFDKDLLSSDKKLQLVLSEDTVLEAFKTKQIVNAQDLEDRDLIVIYGATTRSLPAQTVPSGIEKVILLPQLEDSSDDNDKGTPNSNSSTDNPGNKATAHAKNAIAKEARSMGYKVKWDPKSKLVVLTKGSDTIEVYVGTTKYKVNGIEKKSSVANNLVNGTTYVGSDILDLLKK